MVENTNIGNLENITKMHELKLEPLDYYTLINPRTQQDYDQLMQVCEVGGWLWGGWGVWAHGKSHASSPTSKNHWNEHKENFCITAGDSYNDIENLTFFAFTYNRDDPWSLYESISPQEFYERQGITDDTLKELTKWFEENKPDRVSKGLRGSD